MPKIKSLKPTTQKRPKKIVAAAAPGQALGFGLQYTRLAVMLLTAEEGSTCSLEVMEDVAVVGPKRRVFLGQIKSALVTNPVSDRAESLWKTFFNWIELAKKGVIDCGSTTFEIFVSRQVNGDFVDAFSRAKTLDDATLAIKNARDVLWGKTKSFELKGDLAEGIAPYVNAVFEADQKIFALIVKNFQLTCGSGESHVDVEKIIRGHPVSPSKVRDITIYICGWVKREVDDRLEKSLPAFIKKEEFHKAYLAYRRAVDQDTILKSLAPNFTDEQKAERLPDIFVRQLDLILLKYEEKLGAVSDFLRASADRTLWSKSGDVDKTSFDELDDELNRTWTNRQRAVGIEHQGKKEEEIGLLLYSDCMSHDKTVQGMSAPPHFIPGCYHRLADVQKVGWHPNFKKLLKSLPSDESK
jgi:hypothetical protein